MMGFTVIMAEVGVSMIMSTTRSSRQLKLCLCASSISECRGVDTPVGPYSCNLYTWLVEVISYTLV